MSNYYFLEDTLFAIIVGVKNILHNVQVYYYRYTSMNVLYTFVDSYGSRS